MLEALYTIRRPKIIRIMVTINKQRSILNFDGIISPINYMHN